MKAHFDAVTQKIQAANAKLNAVVSYVDTQAQLHALADGPLYGWEIALKDNFNMKDTLTTASCRLLENHRSIYNATAVERLLAAGAVVVAKTSLDELGMGGTNLSALSGPVRNPYDETRISGGSSGGSAALVGAKLVRMATGSDTGDSVRKPASLCGAVGVKPTYGRISRYGIIPYASSLDHVGYFTQNIADAALVLEVLAGRDDKDMTSSFAKVQAYSQLLDRDLQGCRIGVFTDIQDVVTDPHVVDLFTAFTDKLKAKGAILVEKTMDKTLLRAILPVYYTISNCEAVANHANLDGVRFGASQKGETLDEVMINTRTHGFSSMIKKRFIYGAFGLDQENQDEVFKKAKKVRRKIVDEYQKFFDDVDVVIALAAPGGAPKVEGSVSDVRIDELSDEYLIADNHLIINNFSGFPSVTLPLGLINHLPIGINVTTSPFAEALMFAYAKQFETMIEYGGKPL